jgi:hypothetical protein
VTVVRPEFGPTLPELLGPRIRALPRAGRALLGLLAVLVVAGLVALVFGGSDPGKTVVVRGGDPAFNLLVAPALHRVDPQGDEALRLEGDGTLFTASRRTLPAYKGDANGTLPVLFSGFARQMAGQYDGWTLRQEGRANINKQQGYELFFQFRRDGQTWYGRRTVLVVDPVGGTTAVDLLMLTRRTVATPKADAVAKSGPLKIALRSFRFGTERP